MISRKKRWPAMGAMAMATLWLAGATDGLAAEPAASSETVVVDNTTLWREYHVAGDSIVRTTAGTLRRAEVDLNHYSLADGAGTLWYPPPPHWAAVMFDDSAWPRLRWPQPGPWPGTCTGQDFAPRGIFRNYDNVMILARTAD